MDYLSLCLICKDENDYLPEWLDYHILMGVERFYIYDNDSQFSLRETLKGYIERGWVVVVDIPGEAMQLYAYDHCLQTFGPNTFWLGFIDTDEFLVPKMTLDLKELLKEYEAYGGLAVSSLFFGSNGHQTRPVEGQIAAYTRRTHATFKQNELVKSIVQPGLVQLPNTPHEFIYKETTWCVNEILLRMDFQRFPNHTELIQLNHYFCRSKHEIDLKLQRGNSGAVAWPRKRFDLVNRLATYDDTCIIQNLEALFQKAESNVIGQAAGLLEKMATLAHTRRPLPLKMTPVRDVQSFRVEFSDWSDLKSQTELARGRKDIQQVCECLQAMVKIKPQYINLYVDLAANYLNINEPVLAWEALTKVWELAPNTFIVLVGMLIYFLWMKNFGMAEKICHLILEIAPHNLMSLGFLTEALMGQGRFEEALKVGVPLVELSAQLGELPDGVDIIVLVKKMVDYLLKKKDYTGAVNLWEAAVQCQPGNVNALLELAQSLLRRGDKAGARQRLAQALVLAPQNELVLAGIKQLGPIAGPPSSIPARIKRRH